MSPSSLGGCTQATNSAPRPRLPTLDDGVHVLALDPDQVGPLHALAVDHVLETSARPATPAYWIDDGTTARTYDLAHLAPSPRVLDRLQVARGFTPHQHHDVVRQAARRADGETPLVVAPRVDTHYRDPDCPAGIAEDLLAGAIDALDRTARRYDTPTLVTTDGDAGDVPEPLRAVADRVLSVERTPLGPRFVGDGVETLVYPVESHPDGDCYQTTLAYWRRVVERRVESRGRDAADRPETGSPSPS